MEYCPVEKYNVRLLKQLDELVKIHEILNESIEAGETTYSLQPFTLEQCQDWLTGDEPRFETYVYGGDTCVLGWAALTRFHKRAAYGQTAELSVYVKRSARGSGVGHQLASHAIERARQLGLHSLVLILFPEQVGIVEWAKRFGFLEVGGLKGVVPANPQWHDVVLLQLPLSFSIEKNK